LLELSLGDWAHPEGRSFRIGLSIPKKKWPLFGRATKTKNINFSLSAHVLRRKPIRKPAQKQAVILYANKRVKYDLGYRFTSS
jgi:hypothetical protein